MVKLYTAAEQRDISHALPQQLSCTSTLDSRKYSRVIQVKQCLGLEIFLFNSDKELLDAF